MVTKLASVSITFNYVDVNYGNAINPELLNPKPLNLELPNLNKHPK